MDGVAACLVAGVLTKLDLMDPGTNAVDVLAGRVVYLRRGFVPVVCRSQKDIADGMPIDRALAREKLFFERNPAYRAFSARCGTPYLSRVLYTMLIHAVRAWLPQVRSEISLLSQAAEQQYRDLGDPVETGAWARAAQQRACASLRVCGGASCIHALLPCVPALPHPPTPTQAMRRRKRTCCYACSRASPPTSAT